MNYKPIIPLKDAVIEEARKVADQHPDLAARIAEHDAQVAFNEEEQRRQMLLRANRGCLVCGVLIRRDQMFCSLYCRYL
jgi:hypothetical protein